VFNAHFLESASFILDFFSKLLYCSSVADFTLKQISTDTVVNDSREFLRTEGVFQVFGIKRGTLYNLHKAGEIQGKVLRVRGKLTGVRIWDVQSIRDYIARQSDSSDAWKN
jgi:hypothetical protein